MPLQADSCLPVDDQSCNWLARISQHLLEQTYSAISGCFNGGCEGEVTAYITTGQGDDGVMDALTVALLAIDPSALTISKGPSLWRATFDVRLRESGWPVVRVADGVIVPPPPEEQAMAVSQLLAHGEAIHRRLSSLKASSSLTPPGMTCSQATIGSLTPIFPQGGVAGWTVLVTIDLPWG